MYTYLHVYFLEDLSPPPAQTTKNRKGLKRKKKKRGNMTEIIN